MVCGGRKERRTAAEVPHCRWSGKAQGGPMQADLLPDHPQCHLGPARLHGGQRLTPTQENIMDETQAVQTLGEQIGFGRMMQLAEQIWRERLARDRRGEHTTGPCAALMVPCKHPVRDENGHCEVCCGAGRVTKWVAANLPP